MQSRNIDHADLGNSIDSKLFEKELVPIFDKMKIEKSKPFQIPSMNNINEYESLFHNIYHGILYHFFLGMEKKSRLSYSEYNYLYENFLNIQAFNGERTVYYGKTPIIIISKYTEDKTNRLCESIKPIYSRNIERLTVLKKSIQKRDNHEDNLKVDEIVRQSEEYLKKDADISFEEFDKA